MPVRTSSGWWSKVITVGRASRVAASVDEVLEEVGVAEMEPVEHADDDEDRTELRARARRCPRRRPSRRSADRDGRPARSGATKTLSGASRPAAAVAIATSVAVGVAQPIVLAGPGQAARRTDELAACDGRDLVRGQHDDRERVEPGVDRPEERQEARRALRGGGADRRRAAVASSSVNGPEAVRVSAPRYAALPSRSPRSRASARMYVPAEHATSRTAIGRSGSVPSHDTRSSEWIVTSRSPARRSRRHAPWRRPGGRRP